MSRLDANILFEHFECRNISRNTRIRLHTKKKSAKFAEYTYPFWTNALDRILPSLSIKMAIQRVFQ